MMRRWQIARNGWDSLLEQARAFERIVFEEREAEPERAAELLHAYHDFREANESDRLPLLIHPLHESCEVLLAVRHAEYLLAHLTRPEP